MNKKRPVKKPVIPNVPLELSKTARFLGLPNIENKHISWRFSKADLGGNHSCHNFSHGDFQQLWGRLRAFEKMNVAQLRDDGSFHPMPTSELKPKDKERLIQLELDDIEIMYSFRIEGACRMWCIKFDNILSVLWWDRDHSVCEVEKSHT